MALLSFDNSYGRQRHHALCDSSVLLCGTDVAQNRSPSWKITAASKCVCTYIYVMTQKREIEEQKIDHLCDSRMCAMGFTVMDTHLILKALKR